MFTISCLRIVLFLDHDILALANNIPANKPKSMLNMFGTLSGTLNSMSPAIEMGTLFKEPTRL